MMICLCCKDRKLFALMGKNRTNHWDQIRVVFDGVSSFIASCLKCGRFLFYIKTNARRGAVLSQCAKCHRKIEVPKGIYKDGIAFHCQACTDKFQERKV